MTECARPLADDLLAEYWSGELDPDREMAAEEHLLACGACSRRLEALVALAQGIRLLARRGEVRVVVTREFLSRLEREGLRVRRYSPHTGGRVECTITPQDDLLVGCLAADLTGLTRVDAVFCDVSGAERGRAEDIPFRAAPTEVVLNEPAPAARRYGRQVLIVKLVGVGVEGERLIGEYRFDHFPTPG